MSSSPGGGRLRRWRLLRALRLRPRLSASIVTGLATWVALPWIYATHGESRLLVAWNAGSLLYLALTAHLLATADAASMRRRALHQDEGRAAILLLVVASAAAVLLAVGSQLAVVKGLPAPLRPWHVALAVLTVATSWAFTQVLFALHYAHDFHMERAAGRPDPLTFPGTTEPGYGDFLYFACVIGTSGQTADVSFHGSALRGVGTVHCVLAWAFNATLLGLAVNIAAGLVG